MFTTIMYGVINEVTRQPASAEIPVRRRRGDGQGRSAPRQRTRQVAHPTGPQRPLAGQYRVLADSFKRAAGFY